MSFAATIAVLIASAALYGFAMLKSRHRRNLEKLDISPQGAKKHPYGVVKYVSLVAIAISLTHLVVLLLGLIPQPGE